MARSWQDTSAHAAFVALALVTLLAAPARAAAPADAGMAELLLSVDINDQPVGETALLRRDAAGKLWLNRRDIERWRMLVPQAAVLVDGDEQYYPLDAFAGISYRIDEATQTLRLAARPAAFERSTLSALDTSPVSPSPPGTGGFLNYDVAVSHDSRDSTLGGLVEMNLFGAAGFGVTRFLGRSAGGTFDSTRLESTWTRDFPSRAVSLRLGDGVTSSAQGWGGALRFGGIQVASNYATQPGVVTFATPAIDGEAALPSVIDLYVNGALRFQRDVPMGPFELRDLPVVNGDGNIRLVVRDMLGREVELFQPYYASLQLLRPGLHLYSYEAGLIRESYGTRGTDYGDAIVSATHRLGLSNTFTGELHAAATQNIQTVGASLVSRISVLGTVGGSIAGSRADGRAGSLLGANFEHQSHRVSIGGTLQFSSAGFSHPGLPQSEHVKQSSQMFANLSAGRLGSFGITYTRRRYHDNAPVDVVGVRHTVTLGTLGHLSFSLSHVHSAPRDTVANLMFSRAFGMRSSASLGGEARSGAASVTADVQRNLPAGEGTGFRLLSRVGTLPYHEGNLAYRGKVGTYVLNGSVLGDTQRVEASAEGAVGLLGRHVFASRTVEGSFAIIEVPDTAGVRIYGDNQLIGRSDKNGLLLLPTLRAYEDNPVSIEQADLPLDASIDTLDLNAVPYARSGLLVRFPVRRERGAILRIVFDDGATLPAGSRVRIVGSDTWFPSGTRGEVYVTGLADRNRIEIEGAGQTCQVSVDYPRDAEPLPTLGPFVCSGARP
jgi:outer membrane usher protein